MAFKDYSLNPSDNTTLGDGTYIGPNMLRNKVRPALQQLAADGKGIADEVDQLVGPLTVTSVTGQAVSTRLLLAAIATPAANQSAILTESGREGTFVFSSANNAANVTADPQQGIYVAPASDTTGASGAWVRIFDGERNVLWHGAKGDGTTDDTTAIRAAFSALPATGGGRLRFPAGHTFKVTSYLELLNKAQIVIDARGALISADMTGVAAGILTLRSSCSDITVLGGKWQATNDGGTSWQVEVQSPRTTLDGCHLDKVANTGGGTSYQVYVRYGADGFKMIGCRTSGADGVFCEASDVLFSGSTFVAETTGGDDGIALKGIQGVTQNIRVVGCHFENHAAMLSIGSEVGTAGANDPTFSKAVRNVTFVGNTGKKCASIALIKPGTVMAYDYRDGTVEGIVISSNSLTDQTGANFRSGIRLTAARGARVRNISGRNNVIIARSYDDNTGGRRMGAVDIYAIDYTAVNPGINAPSFSNIDLHVHYSDPLNGAAGSAAPNPAPVTNIAAVELQTATHGTMSNITLDIRGNGSNLSGVFVGPGLDDAVTLDNAALTNINTGGSAASYGGIHVASRVQVNNATISMTTGYPYKLEGTGDIIAPNTTEDVFYVGQVNAGNADTQYPYRAKRRVQLIEMLLGTTNAVAQSDTNYTALSHRNLGGSGNVFNTAQTKATGSTGGSNPLFALVAGQRSTIYRYRDVTADIDKQEAIFSRGSILQSSKADTGTGAALTNARLTVRAAPC